MESHIELLIKGTDIEQRRRDNNRTDETKAIPSTKKEMDESEYKAKRLEIPRTFHIINQNKHKGV